MLKDKEENLKDKDENILLEERLHLRVFDDTIDVLYRPNHNYLIFLENNEEGREKIKELATMSRDEFKIFLKSIPSFTKYTKDMDKDIKNSSLESWYLGAWSLQTKKILEKIGVENPIEKPIYFDELKPL